MPSVPDDRRDILADEIARDWDELEEADPGASARLGRAMGRVLFAAWRATSERAATAEQDAES